MFGEEIIDLEYQLKIEGKRRIRIPAKTKVVAQESIGMLFNLNKNCLLLYNKKEYEEMLNKTLMALEKMKQSKKYDAKFLRSLQRNFFATYCFPEEKTDDYLLLLLPKQAIEILEITNSVYAVGNNTHLELYKDKETYQLLHQKE